MSSTNFVAASCPKLIFLAAAAGVIYNSWILGYWLNPVVARHDLASELEALQQPFNWLFTTGDIVCGLLVILLSVILWRRRTSKRHWTNKLASITFGLFGLGTLLDALLPLSCDPTIQQCPITIHDPLLLAHGFFSIAASLALFISVVAVWWTRRHNPLTAALIIGYVLFGIFSVVSLVTPGQDSWAQHYSLLFDGLCLTVVTAMLASQKSDRQHKQT